MDQRNKRKEPAAHSPQRREMVKAGAALAGSAALGLPGIVAGQAASAQSWPNRPVRIVVPYGPAGTADILGRILGQQLSKQLGAPFVVENRGGASTTIGAAEVAKSPADGYTIMVVTPTFAIATSVYPNLPFDGPKDFVPVALLMTTPLLLVVNPATGIKTVAEYIQVAKAKPGRISFASSGSGSTPHLAFELLKGQGGIELLHIPYKGGGEAVQSVLAGTTDSYFSAPIESGEHIKAGKLVALGASALKRTPGLANIPTLAESGLPGFEITHYTAVLVKAGTPQDIINKLSENIVRAIQTPEVRERIAQNGDVPLGTLAEATALFADEYTRWAKAVKAADIKP
jgi:tripartite-type tricarboxylate transporter receptor subunit TctC